MVVVTKFGVTVSYVDLLQMVLVALKLQGHISLSWWLTLLPYIIVGGYYMFMLYLEVLLNYQEIRDSRK